MSELTDDQVFGPEEMSDAEVFGPKAIQAPTTVPRAFIARFQSDDDTFTELNKTVGNTVAGRIAAAAAEGASAGFGEHPLGISPEDTKKLQKLGVFQDPEAPKDITSGIRFMNEAAMRPAVTAVEAFFRAGNAAVMGAGATFGQIGAEVTGANDAEAARARRDGAQFATMATLLSMGHPVARIERGPMGELRSQPIGGLPKGEDFAAAAEIVAGEKAPMPVQEKLLRAYEEKGLHPSEVAHDAQSDPVVAQRLLSDDPGVTLPGGAPRGEITALEAGEKIEGPAIKIGDDIYTGISHSHALDRAAKQHSISPEAFLDQLEGKNNVGLDGFITSDGRFLTRKEAYAIQDVIDAKRRAAAEGGGGEGGKPPGETSESPSFEDAQKKILDKISVGESAPKEGWSWDKFYRQAIDDLHPLKAVDEDAYQLARLTRGQFGKAEHFIEHGTFDFNTYKTNGKPLAEIIEPVARDLDGFRAYLASKRAIEIEASGRKSGMDLEAAQRVAAEGEGKYGRAAADLQGYQENLLAYLRDSGVISGDAFTAMREAGQNYVPFYRVFEPESGAPAGKGFGPGSPIKKLKGSERDIVDPLESIVKNTYAFISVAERNAVGIKLIDALKEQGEKVTTGKLPRDAELVDYLKEQGITEPEKLADFVQSAAREDGDTLSAWRDGKREQVQVKDPELVAAFRGLDQSSVDMLIRVLAAPAKFLRAGATLSPDFIVRNIVRDFMTAFVNSGSALFSPIDTIKGLVGVVRKDVDFQNWMKGGGANATMVALDRRYLQESLRKLNGETGLMERGWNVVTSPIRGLRLVSELAENATRLGEFKKLTGESKADIQSAAYASREVTLDFARIGASMRAYNMITAFGNAQIQGLDRIGRAFVDRPTNTMAKVAGGITLPSVLLWWANHEDPRYQELPHWQKDMFWIVMTKDHVFRIPKPFELGVVFGSGVERILDATVGQNKEAFDGLGKSIAQVIMPNYIPTAGQPLLEQFANRSSMSDRTLIPADMEKLLPEYQYTPYTTEVAKKLGQVVSAFPGIRSESMGPGAPFGPVARAVSSPILLENYVRAWTGGLGVYAMQAADAALRKTGVLPDPVTPTPTLSDIPVVKAFMVRYPSASTQSIQDFYDQHEVTKRYYDTWLAKAKEGDVDAMSRIQAAGGPMMFVRLDAIKETLSDHSKLVRDIYKNQTITAPEKRQLIDGLYFNMIEIGKAGKKMLTDSEAALRRETSGQP